MDSPKNNPKTSTSENNNAPTIKIKKPTIHNFTVTAEISIPKQKIEDKKLSQVVIENKKGTFRIITPREALLVNNKISVELSEKDEVITPKYIYKD